MRVLPRLLSNTAIYWMKSLLHRGVPSFFFASQRSTLIFFCKLEEYPHFFLQILGVALSFFAIQGGGQFFFAFCKFTKFLQTEPIRAWSYPVRTRSPYILTVKSVCRYVCLNGITQSLHYITLSKPAPRSGLPVSHYSSSLTRYHLLPHHVGSFIGRKLIS